MYNTFEEYKIKFDLPLTSSRNKQYGDFIWELSQLEFQLSNYLHFEETARKYMDVRIDKIPKLVRGLFSYDYWAYHLFNDQEKVEFHFENPYREVKSVWIDKSSIRNVEKLTLYLNGRQKL
jgi:hypothetical protein